MFKARCPKCNVTSEVINGKCRNCNYDIFEFMKSNGLIDGNKLITDKAFICPNCGTIDGGTSIRLKCYECGTPYKSTDVNRNDPIKVLELCKREFVEKYVGDTINWDIFNKRDEKWQKRLQEDNERDRKKQAKEQARQDAINHPKCPKCGSTAITAGQRGYTLLTGFLGSNKTVNRCANCGYSWKPGR